MIDIRARACYIANELAKKHGGHPRKYMRQAWSIAKGESDSGTIVFNDNTKKTKTSENIKAKPIHKFYYVLYKENKDSELKESIVPASSKEEAEKLFNNPDNEFGPRNEIFSVSRINKLPKDWVVSYIDKNKIQFARLIMDTDIEDKTQIIGHFRGQEVTIDIDKVTAINKPKRLN